MSTVTIDGRHIHHTDTGGAGPVVVFSHGLFMDGSMFTPQIEALRDRFRCITWDQRGHGGTPPATAPFSYYDSAADLIGLLDVLGIPHAALLGMSQGGYLSLRAALTHPDRVASLVLVSTQASAENPYNVTQYDQLIAAWETSGLTDELAATVAAIVLAPAAPGVEAWIERWRAITPDNLRRIYQTLVSRDDITERLPEITVPALVLWGGNDLAVTETNAKALAHGLADSTFVHVPGVAHGMSLINPSLVTPHIEKFLDRDNECR